MLQSLARTDRSSLSDGGLFVTLTYPREWPPSTAACKRHLEALRKRLERRWPHAWFYWKLEFQCRGAEHFHLLIFGLPTVNPEWFHDAWHDIVRLGNHWHTEYGADVKRMHTWRQAGAYCAKYAAKVEQHATTPTPGRFWGIATRRNRVETILEAGISELEFYRIRRLFRRYINAPRGYHAPGGSRSGVWVRISNAGAKMALASAASAIERAPPNSSGTLPVTPYGHGTPPVDSARNSTGCRRGGRPNRSGRTGDKPNIRLFDASDLQRRRAGRRVA